MKLGKVTVLAFLVFTILYWMGILVVRWFGVMDSVPFTELLSSSSGHHSYVFLKSSVVFDVLCIVLFTSLTLCLYIRFTQIALILY